MFNRYTERDLREAIGLTTDPDAQALLRHELAHREALERTQEVRRG
jgi:hypothetical protein